MTVCITAGDGTPPARANPQKKALCREPHWEENAEAGQGSQLLPLPRSAADGRYPAPRGCCGDVPRGSVSPAGALGWAVRSCGPFVMARAKVPFIERERE